MSIEYFEDIKLHQKYISRGYHLKENDIIDFARQWDPYPSHVDPGVSGGLFASAAQLLAIWYKLASEEDFNGAWIAGLGWDETRFLTHARPGDVLVLEKEVTWKRESKSNPNAGVIHYSVRLLNQRDEIVLTSGAPVLFQKRP
jgi:acyl dehydratase